MPRPLIVVSLLLIGLALPAWAEGPPAAQVSYSAEYIMETSEVAIRGKMNVVPGKERREDYLDAGETMISIRRDDLGKTWILLPSEQMYLEVSADAPQDEANSRAPGPEDYDTQMTEVGREEINGLMTNKSKVIMTGKDGSKMGGFWWTTDDGILVKMDVIAINEGEKMRMKRELSNIVVEPQDNALFEIPEGYNSLMMGIGAGMLGIPGMGGTADEPEDEDGAADEGQEPGKSGFGLDTLKGVLDVVN